MSRFVDFVLATLISFLTNFYLIIPYWDKLKEGMLKTEMDVEEVNKKYLLLCTSSYVTVGILLFFGIFIVKKLLKYLDK